VRRNEKIEIAKSLLQSALSNQEIAKHTGLSIEQIKQLHNEKP
jgi:Trp operon repressor